jgi:hypothetical protein
VNITNDCWLYRQGETMTKKPVVVEIDPKRISFESTWITKDNVDELVKEYKYKQDLLSNNGITKLEV